MSRKARLTEKELGLLARAASERPGETAKTVLARYIELEGRPVSLSTVEKKLADWRRDETIPPATAALPTEERPLGLEAPWSLGASAQAEYGMTPEATGDLLAVWKYCLATGHVFTIREARWVVRLRNAIPDYKGRISELFAYAYEYAIRERICRILNKQIDTIDLDGELGINDRERFVYRALGLVPRLAVPFHPRQTEKAIDFLKHLAWPASAATMTAFFNIPKAAKDTGDIDEMRKLFRHTENLPAEQDRIYAALLLFLSKGATWNTLSVQDYLLILSGLREWVTEVISSKHLLEYEMLDDTGGIKPTDILDPAFLEVVGYEVNIKTTNKAKGAHHERTHSKEVQE